VKIPSEDGGCKLCDDFRDSLLLSWAGTSITEVSPDKNVR